MEEFGALDEVYKEHYGVKTKEEELAEQEEAAEQLSRVAKQSSKIERLLVEKYKAEAATKEGREATAQRPTCETGT